MKKRIKTLFGRLTRNKKKVVERIGKANNLVFDYTVNIGGLGILESIFEQREYADYFPFYQKVTVIDIGAHYGYFSLFASRNLNDASRIISIEPDSANFSVLQYNISANEIQNIKVIHGAVGAENKIAKLFKGSSANNSLINNYQLASANRYEEIEETTLTSIIEENKLERIDFLKMDCEGAEYEILENLPDSIFEKIITLSMEFHDLKDFRYTGARLIEILEDKKFEIVKYKYDHTYMGLNYGKIIATRVRNKTH
jgi:FkbM family methyltransferase